MMEKTNQEINTPIKKLINVVSKLRDPIDGCPWDLNQNHKSLIPYAIEEAHEVADAIRHGNDEELCDELGDLLLQVVLHAQIASEDKRFSFDDIAKAAEKKMIRRHPHVFEKNNAEKTSLKEIKNNWEEIKKEEQNITESKTPISHALMKKIRSQAPLSNSITISKKTLQNGFNWKYIQEPWSKIDEDLSTLKYVLRNQKNLIIAANKIGSIVFNLINISNINRISFEEGIIKINKEILSQIEYVESSCNGKKFNEVPNKQLQLLWEEAKINMKKEQY